MKVVLNSIEKDVRMFASIEHLTASDMKEEAAFYKKNKSYKNPWFMFYSPTYENLLHVAKSMA